VYERLLVKGEGGIFTIIETYHLRGGCTQIEPFILLLFFRQIVSTFKV